LVFVTRYSIIGNRDSAGAEDLIFRLAREVRGMVKNRNDKSESHRAAAHIKESLKNNAPDDKATITSAESVSLEASDARYLVNRIARYTQDPQKEITMGETNLEHVYPQNPKPQEWGGETNQGKLEPLTWNLGNLTIFGKRANRKAANAEYPAKKARFSTSAVVMTSEIAKKYSDWDEATIADRTKRLAKLVVQVWNFDNPSRV
jgi:hypothetical protein